MKRLGRLPAIVRHIEWKVSVEPVKWMPANSPLANTGLPTSPPRPGTKLMTPGGRPAASSSLSTYQFERIEVEAGFQSTVLPISAGELGRLAPIAVKLNGVTAKTKPSSGR